MKKLFVTLLATLLPFMIFFASGTAVASGGPHQQGKQAHVHTAAVTCFHDTCTGKDPIQTGCAADAVTVDSTSIIGPDGTEINLNLRFSPTCGTNWAQGTSNIGPVPMQVVVSREHGVDGPFMIECEPLDCSSFVTTTDAFTDMVWAPDVAARASGRFSLANVSGGPVPLCVTQDSVGLPCSA